MTTTKLLLTNANLLPLVGANLLRLTTRGRLYSASTKLSYLARKLLLHLEDLLEKVSAWRQTSLGE